jgi:hypothetical protein
MPMGVGGGAFVMTQRKNLKQLVRDHMAKNGLRYAAARRSVIAGQSKSNSPHRPGSVPGATALRILLAHAGRDVTEAMAFGLAGGVGIGVFAFLYEKADFASFFVSGRHLWFDEATYLKQACARLGLKTVVKEASSPKAAEKILRETLAQYGPCVAWVDMAGLPHRGLPSQFSGGGYHIVTVYSIDDAAGTALIGDLADEPIAIPLSDLTTARGRIKKDKYRVLAVEKSTAKPDLKSEIADALKACQKGLAGEGAPKNAKKNFTLEAVQNWADRLIATKGKDSWEFAFAPGKRMWSGLTMMHMFIEYWGSDGGLCRPLMADFLNEAADALKKPALRELAKLYADLGRMWSDLADAALPDRVPIFAKAKALYARYAELLNSAGTPKEKKTCWAELDELAKQATAKFPLSTAQSAELRAELAGRVRAIHAAESAALARLGELI